MIFLECSQRLTLKEKLGFAIPVGHFQTLQADKDMLTADRDKLGKAPLTPVHGGSGGQASSSRSSVGLG